MWVVCPSGRARGVWPVKTRVAKFSGAAVLLSCSLTPTDWQRCTLGIVRVLLSSVFFAMVRVQSGLGCVLRSDSSSRLAG